MCVLILFDKMIGRVGVLRLTDINTCGVRTPYQMKSQPPPLQKQTDTRHAHTNDINKTEQPPRWRAFQCRRCCGRGRVTKGGRGTPTP